MYEVNQPLPNQTSMPPIMGDETTPRAKNANVFNQMKKLKVPFVAQIFGALTLIVTVAGLLTAQQLSQTSQDIASQAQTALPIDLSIQPATKTMAVNSEEKFNVEINPNGRQPTAASLIIKYDPTFVSVHRGNYISPFTNILHDLDPRSGQTTVAVGTVPTTIITARSNLLQFTVSALNKKGTTKVTLVGSEVAAAGSSTNQAKIIGDLTLTIGDAPSSPPPVSPPPADSPKLNLMFRVQGVTKAGISKEAEVWLKYKHKTTGQMIVKKYNHNYVSSAASTPDSTPVGAFKNAELLTLTDLNLDEVDRTNSQYPTFGTGIEVYVKTPTSLRKKLGELTYESTNTPVRIKGVFVADADRLLVGDFYRPTADQINVIRSLDLGKLLDAFTLSTNGVSVPVTDQNKAQIGQFDIDNNGTINNFDVSLFLGNFTTATEVSIKGDEP